MVMYDYTLDPSGDAVLILENPNAPFAIWHGVSGDKLRPSRASPVPTEDQPAAIHEPVAFLVSSRHLILASPVLKAALDGGWKESAPRETDNLREVRTEGWDVQAMVIFMSIIHHKWSQVPRDVDLELLAKIAVVADYYQTYEMAQFIGTLWVGRLRKPLPAVYGRELVLWICVSLTFRHHGAFRHATKIAVRDCRGDLETLELPILSAVVGMKRPVCIDKFRWQYHANDSQTR